MTNPSPTTPTTTPIEPEHVHDWTPWGPSPLTETAGVERRMRSCRGCDLTQDEPTPVVRETPFGLVPESAIEAALLVAAGYAMPADARDSIVRGIVAAAVPHIERAIRDKIAAEFEALPVARLTQDFMPGVTRTMSYVERDAARRVARGGEATE
jgi:hypothetical protein